PGLRLLATSRQALGLTGELAWRVPSLSLPDAKALAVRSNEASPLPAHQALLQFEAVQLFVERAVHHHPPFELTARNAEAVAQVCCRLDGIALTLELAAVRLKVLTV